MQYVIMMIIVAWLAIADFVTGMIKAYVTGTLNSAKMRKGGVNKVGELVVMATACGLEAGINALSQYYDISERLAAITGTVTAILIFSYIAVMEMISILENFAEINPDAAGWVNKLVKHLRAHEEKRETEKVKDDNVDDKKENGENQKNL
ncbi:phage holin family protein [Ruminococcus sp.]|uniref:phage holin family protein n=1 Tax=Ruminococcus sp. TaxID=41978 RepID=UPI001B6A3EA6|nr:phage holin family protein [Ruminococcus sp.]MBP5433733.1 phage holin family protein [Ruminococcus sp.]